MEHPNTALRLGDAPMENRSCFSVLFLYQRTIILWLNARLFVLTWSSDLKKCAHGSYCAKKKEEWFILLQLNIIIVKPVICHGWGSAKGVNVTSLFLDKYFIKNKTTRHAPKCQWQVIVRMHVHLTVTLGPYHQ